jgi:hypothetical protein
MSDDKFHVYHFQMPSQYWLTSTFLRFQEFYESPKFRGQGFTLDEFQDWYVTTRANGEFSYYIDWGGFNFPSYVVDRFTPSRFGPFTRKEVWLLDQLQDVPDKFYVIGTYLNPKRAGLIQHEVVHGLFYLYEDYAQAVNEVVQGHDFEEFKQALRDMGYCEEVLVDEINAYLTTGLVKALRGKSAPAVRSCKSKLTRLFRKRFGTNISNEQQSAEFVQQRIHHMDGSSVIPTANS